MHIVNKSNSIVRNVKYENINVEYDAWIPRQMLQKKENKKQVYIPDPNDKMVYFAISIDSTTKGSLIENVSYENINIVGRNDVPSVMRAKDGECPIRNVSIKNLRMNGKEIKDVSSANLKLKNIAEFRFQ